MATIAQPTYEQGQEVIFLGEHYTLLTVLQLAEPPHRGWPTGEYALLWKPTWAKPQTVIAPLGDLTQAANLAA